MWLNNRGQIKRRLEVAKLWIVSQARLKCCRPPSSGTPRPRIAFWKPCLGWTIMKAITCAMCRRTSAGCVRQTDSALSRVQKQACVGRTPLNPLPVWPLQRLDLLPQHKHTRVFPVHSAVKDCAMKTTAELHKWRQRLMKFHEILPIHSWHFISLGQQILI